MFWGVEFVQDKATKRPFEASKNLTAKIVKAGLEVRCVKLRSVRHVHCVAVHT